MNEVGSVLKQQLTMDGVLRMAFRTPGVKIKRDIFLRKELIKYCPEDVIKAAISGNPAKAGISKELINKVSKSVIDFETAKVAGLSAAASLPGSIAIPAAVGVAATDITSYFAHILRVVQELAYLYGFEEFDFSEDSIDSETMNYIMVFMGVMFGVQGATSALGKLANAVAAQVAKKLAQKSLTKGIVYPIVKQTAKTIGIKMTKQIFADTVASAIPIAGSLLSGWLTYAMFVPCCKKLRDTLMGYDLCDPDYYRKNNAKSGKDNGKKNAIR